MTIADLEKGRSGQVLNVGGTGSLRRHLLDMGLIPGAEVRMVGSAPLGDPVEILVHGYSLTLRLAEARDIEIQPVVPEGADASSAAPQDDQAYNVSLHEHNSHPGLGEAGKYHSKDHENPLPKGTTLSFALAGQQNSGKTTLFNVLTGSNQHVGNFPGVTVDRKDGVIKGHPETRITDLPGIYSLSPYTAEEIVSRRFILEQDVKGIIDIADANNIERNLYLTIQLMELEVPMVLALNMMDELRGNGGSIRINEMERILGIPVVPIAAAKEEGVEELVEHAIHVAQYQEKPARQDFCDKEDHGGAVHRCLHGVMHLIEDHAAAAGIPVRFAASKLVEGDSLVEEALKLDANEREAIEHIICEMEAERGLDRAAAIADMRYSFIQRLCEKTVVRPKQSKEYKRSRRIDKVLTGKWTAIPIFLIVMALVIWLTIDVLGAPLQEWLDAGIGALGDGVAAALERWGVSPAVRSLVVDGIFGGVGSVLSFLPIIVILFFFLSMLEDSGYIARVAFFMDKLLRHLGLSGRSIVPMLLGFGCTVPAVMSTRTLPSERDRKMTILLTPFMSCTAKLPIYGFFVAAFFPRQSWIIITGLYILGIFTSILMAYLLKNTLFKGEAVPFVMELPNYRVPTPRNVIQLLWEKAKDFLHRAFTVILIATIVVWFLKSFDFRLNLVADSHDSILAAIAGLLAPLLAPVGLGDWRIVTSLICGFMAKESVVSIMQTLFGGGLASLGALTAASMLVFSLLYTPCVAAIASVRRELGRGWACGVVLWQCFVAWFAALLVHLIGALLGLG